jgi:DNA-binding NtrC family response regulator
LANILVIDDEPVLLGLVSTALRRDGHQVTAMDDPLAATAAYKSGGLPVDLLLADVSLRPISGFEIFKRFMKAGFNGPVLFMSGYPAVSGIIVESIGARAVLEKPFTAPELRSAVRQALSKIKGKSLDTGSTGGMQPIEPAREREL